ncbi:MAG: sigma-54-dependent transcriptional regulator [Magnetovibrionaceae bacterium]
MALDVLIVDDEPDIRELVAGLLEDEGYATREAGDSEEALSAIAQRRPNLVLLDIWLQGSAMDGIGILKAVKAIHADLPIIMMSGHGTVETAVEALKEGAYDFVEKPFKADRLLILIERALEADRLKRENAELKRHVPLAGELVGSSSVTNALRQAAGKVAKTNSRLLITGPAGSGKEVLARMVHGASLRSNAEFVVLNCANMAPDRMEEELFGLEATANVPRRTGTFERAHGGTLFLDEVADMPLETQGRIVRVLQEQIFTRVGGSEQVSVDVRVIAATNRNLPALIEQGVFREDLFYRLNVVPLEVPPLIDRRQDVPEIAGYLMGRLADQLGQPAREIANDAMALLQSYSWPGNVRELRNVIERMLITAPGEATEPIGKDGLPGEIVSGAAAQASSGASAEVLAMPMRDAREVFERDYLKAQVDRFGGNISRTAEFVGMERSALHRKLKSLGLTGDDRKRESGG